MSKTERKLVKFAKEHNLKLTERAVNSGSDIRFEVILSGFDTNNMLTVSSRTRAKAYEAMLVTAADFVKSNRTVVP